MRDRYMRPFRLVLLVFLFLGSAVLAYLLRDVVYELLVVPIAYTLWLLQLTYLAIPQLVKWIVFLALLLLGLVWRLLPDFVGPARPRLPRHPVEGRLEALALGLRRARTSNYFKWQLANRLGRLSRHISEAAGLPDLSSRPSDTVRGYLDAGLNQSFVDFPSSRGRFSRRQPTPLDADPAEVVQYLESRMELNHDGRPRSR